MEPPQRRGPAAVLAGVLLLVLLAPLLAGCLAGPLGPSGDGGGPAAYPRGVHPYPAGDGSEWPPGLEGPFEVAGIEEVRVPSFDGVELHGWIVRPELPEDGGARAPVVLWSAPYFGQCGFLYVPPRAPPDCGYRTGDDPELWDNSNVAEAVPVRFLVEHGYAVAIFNVRGTGNSGGCFEWFGPGEQRDQAHLVEWLGTRDWSNGRVGMMGLSYHGTTPFEAAIQDPPHLKTVVVAGTVSDAYTFSHTPQGATFTTIGLFDVHFAARVTWSPPVMGDVGHWTVDHAPVVPERACEDVAKAMTEDTTGTYTDVRDAAFWDARRLIDRFPDITASVLLTHGFQDLWYSGHQQQESAVWAALPNATPKRMLEGQWGHQFPNFNTFIPEWTVDDWNETLLTWLDFWLKGLGEAPPGVGDVDYQDGTGAWHRSTAWPPTEAVGEALYLAGDRLAPAMPGDGGGEGGDGGSADGARSFRSRPLDGGPEDVLCPDLGDAALPGDAPPGLLYATDPLDAPVLVAGNPFAYLRLSSDRPGGLVAVHLFDVGPDFACQGGAPVDARRIATGAADLRFHRGTFEGTDFPTGDPTPVRIDITNLAEVVGTGHRLAAVVSYGDPISRTAQPWAPAVTVLADGGAEASHLVVPVVEGTFGGDAPALEYPPRPFVPGTMD